MYLEVIPGINFYFIRDKKQKFTRKSYAMLLKQAMSSGIQSVELLITSQSPFSIFQSDIRQKQQNAK